MDLACSAKIPALVKELKGKSPVLLSVDNLIDTAYRTSNSILMNEAVMRVKKDPILFHDGPAAGYRALLNVSAEKYKAFREHWIKVNKYDQCMNVLLRLDCVYAAGIGKPELIHEYLPTIEFEYMTLDQLRSSLQYPCIKDSPLIKHMMNHICLRRPRKRTLEV